jgi:hypothetical protein
MCGGKNFPSVKFHLYVIHLDKRAGRGRLILDNLGGLPITMGVAEIAAGRGAK